MSFILRSNIFSISFFVILFSFILINELTAGFIRIESSRVGHGIGRSLHEEPKVPNFWDRRQRHSDFELVPRMVIAIEPMVAIGSYAVRYGSEDGWVVVTKDGTLSAHFEHTVAVTDDGADVLTDGR